MCINPMSFMTMQKVMLHTNMYDCASSKQTCVPLQNNSLLITQQAISARITKHVGANMYTYRDYIISYQHSLHKPASRVNSTRSVIPSTANIAATLKPSPYLAFSTLCAPWNSLTQNVELLSISCQCATFSDHRCKVQLRFTLNLHIILRRASSSIFTRDAQISLISNTVNSLS